MKIALDATYALDPHPTGIGVYSRRIIQGLAASYPDDVFLLCYRSHRFLRAFGEPSPGNCRRRLLLDNFLPPGAQLFHGLNQRLPRVRYRRMVATFHDLFVLTGEYSSPEFRRRFAEQARTAAERSDLIIAVSSFTASQVHELLNVERSRVRVIPHGFSPPPGAPPPSRERMILNVGAIQKRKNVGGLVDAFEATPPGWRLVLAGSPSGFGAEEILERIRVSARSADIHVEGYVSSQRLEQLYAQASIFVFPSFDEGFGMPVLEAMARGIPVITSNRSALPEVAGEAALLVDPHEPEEIAGAMLRLIEDAGLREQLGSAGRNRATEFSWRKAAEETWAVYKELAG